MCSISGWLSQKPLSTYISTNLARALIYYGQERGRQSAGIYFNGQLHKAAMDPEDFIDTLTFDEVFTTEAPVGEGNICLMHTRQPTCGGLGDEQAQPFVKGDAVTVHNGWYFDTHGIKTQFNIKKPSGVDSELACTYIAQYGPMKLPEFIKNSSGASAIACKWKDELYLMRSGNPIVYCTVPMRGNKLLVFASTEEQLLCALRYCFLLYNPSVKKLAEGILFKMELKGPVAMSTDPANHDEGYSWGYYGTHFSRDNYRPGAWQRWIDGDNSEELQEELDTLRDDALAKAWLDADEYGYYEASTTAEEMEFWIDLAEERKDRMYPPTKEQADGYTD